MIQTVHVISKLALLKHLNSILGIHMTDQLYLSLDMKKKTQTHNKMSKVSNMNSEGPDQAVKLKDSQSLHIHPFRTRIQILFILSVKVRPNYTYSHCFDNDSRLNYTNYTNLQAMCLDNEGQRKSYKFESCLS